MKTFQKFALSLALLPAFAFATSPMLENKVVSPSLVQVKIADIGREGSILKTRQQHPTTEFLIGIPVTVSTGSACIDFVGQEATVNAQGVTRLRALGATDPVVDACIEIFPLPVATQLTFSMSVLTGGIVQAPQFHKRYVQIEGAGMFQVTLDLYADRVTIQPAFIKH